MALLFSVHYSPQCGSNRFFKFLDLQDNCHEFFTITRKETSACISGLHKASAGLSTHTT